jgi:hypothetical protein
VGGVAGLGWLGLRGLDLRSAASYDSCLRCGGTGLLGLYLISAAYASRLQVRGWVGLGALCV